MRLCCLVLLFCPSNTLDKSNSHAYPVRGFYMSLPCHNYIFYCIEETFILFRWGEETCAYIPFFNCIFLFSSLFWDITSILSFCYHSLWFDFFFSLYILPHEFCSCWNVWFSIDDNRGSFMANIDVLDSAYDKKYVLCECLKKISVSFWILFDICFDKSHINVILAMKIAHKLFFIMYSCAK